MIRLVVAGVVAALALSACGGDEIEPILTVDGVPDTPAPGLQVRPVLGVLADLECDLLADPADPASLPGNQPAADQVALCDVDGLGQRLGPAAVVGGIERARAIKLRGVQGVGGHGLAIRLEKDAASRVADLARSASSSDSRLALVVDGLVISSPTVASTIGGRLLLVGGQYDEAQADLYADRMTP